MLLYRLERGNNKDGFTTVFTTDANGVFSKVKLIQQDTGNTNKYLRQWTDREYTYIDYGSWTDFLRYKEISLEELKEKEDQ
jgi:hypothetical protein